MSFYILTHGDESDYSVVGLLDGPEVAEQWTTALKDGDTGYHIESVEIIPTSGPPTLLTVYYANFRGDPLGGRYELVWNEEVVIKELPNPGVSINDADLGVTYPYLSGPWKGWWLVTATGTDRAKVEAILNAEIDRVAKGLQEGRDPQSILATS